MKTIAILYPLADKTMRPKLRAAQENAALAYAAGMKEQGAIVLVPLSTHEETLLAMDKLASVHLICMPGWKEDAAVSVVARSAMLHGVPVHRFYPPNPCIVCEDYIRFAGAGEMPCHMWPCPYGSEGVERVQ